MKKIKLTRGYNAIIDDDDFERVNKHGWVATVDINKKTVYAYASINYKGVSLHRFIMNFPDGEVDHKNSNKLDNRKENLRICTHHQNNMNTSIRRNRKYGAKYKGVHWHKENKRWRAVIKLNEKPISLGCYGTQEDAAIAYNDAAIKYHGEYARLNVISTISKSGA